MFDALYDSEQIRFVGVRDERTGTHMADGYARASGKAGIILAGQNGPGTTNLVTGLAQAKAAYSPVVAIAGALSTEHVYRDAFQEVDQQALFTPVTKKTWTAPSAERVPELFREAFRTALSPRCGPVLLNLPRNVLSAEADIDTSQRPEVYRNEQWPAANAEQIVKAAALLENAKQPVIIAGGGIKNSSSHQAAIGLAETINCPIVTSPGHGDAIPFHESRNAGQMGPRGNPVASRLVCEADVIVALGTRLGFNSTFYSYDNINKDARIIQIELEPTALGRYFPIDVGIWSDAATAAKQLSEALQVRRDRKTADQWMSSYLTERKEWLAARDNDADEGHPVQPSGLFKAFRSVLPENAAITLDAGTLCLQATDALQYAGPKSLFLSLIHISEPTRPY